MNQHPFDPGYANGVCVVCGLPAGDPIHTTSPLPLPTDPPSVSGTSVVRDSGSR